MNWAARRDQTMIERYTANVGHPPENRYTSGQAGMQWAYPRSIVAGVRVPRKHGERFAFLSSLTNATVRKEQT